MLRHLSVALGIIATVTLGACADQPERYPAYDGTDLDCADLNGPVRVDSYDPHGLDADGDGIGCEANR